MFTAMDISEIKLNVKMKRKKNQQLPLNILKIIKYLNINLIGENLT